MRQPCCREEEAMGRFGDRYSDRQKQKGAHSNHQREEDWIRVDT